MLIPILVRVSCREAPRLSVKNTCFLLSPSTAIVKLIQFNDQFNVIVAHCLSRVERISIRSFPSRLAPGLPFCLIRSALAGG